VLSLVLLYRIFFVLFLLNHLYSTSTYTCSTPAHCLAGIYSCFSRLYLFSQKNSYCVFLVLVMFSTSLASTLDILFSTHSLYPSRLFLLGSLFYPMSTTKISFLVHMTRYSYPPPSLYSSHILLPYRSHCFISTSCPVLVPYAHSSPFALHQSTTSPVRYHSVTYSVVSL
jgi:hypothetical protein